VTTTLTLTESRRKVACSLCGKRVSVPRDQMALVEAANQHQDVNEALQDGYSTVPVGEPGQEHETVIVCDACWTTASGRTP